MRTAVSIPDELFEQAESISRQLGVSRSEFYQRALAAYLTREADAEITRRLNDVYKSPEDSALDPVLQKMQHTVWVREEW